MCLSSLLAALLLLFAEPQALIQELLLKIDSASYYEGVKQKKLLAMREEYARTLPASEERYDACMSLGGGYSGFVADSSILWFENAAAEALLLGREDLYYGATLSKAGKLNAAGCFLESAQVIETIPFERLSREGRANYYSQLSGLYHSLYMTHPPGSSYRLEFTKRYAQYSDSLLSYLDPASAQYLREMEKRSGRAGNTEEALRINDLRLERVGSSRFADSYALVMYDRNAIYRNYMHRPLSDHVEYLFEAAISDICHANRNSAALRFIELYLVSVNEVAVAKRVSTYYYRSLVKYGSRTRLLEGLNVSMRINDEYVEMLRHQKRIINHGLWLLCAMFVFIFLVLTALVLYIRRVSRLNAQLERSNKVAHSYILGFFDLYSANMARLQNLRSRINVRLRRGDKDYVLALTDPSKDVAGEELRELYAHFDDAFLGIYPDFVEKFNALLRPDCRISLKKDEKLNMELRIFAVIKLGISDSAQIAQILHCSIKTVYNKRSEMNGKLAVSREEFQKAISLI